VIYNYFVDQNLKKFLDQFFQLKIAGKKVRLPYWRNKINFAGLRRIQGPFGGKGTPAQIRQATYQKAREEKIDLEPYSAKQIRQFMKQKKIGLDCSGFAFQVLNFLQPNFWKSLKMAPGKSKNPIKKFNANALTAQENTVKINKTADIKVGDLIPVGFCPNKKQIDHIMIVVDKNNREIVYAHSSNKTKPSGPHLGKIIITDPQKPLEEQKWQEKLADGQPLLQLAKEPLKTMGVRRIRNLKTR
jgi:hypothetical protein